MHPARQTIPVTTAREPTAVAPGMPVVKALMPPIPGMAAAKAPLPQIPEMTAAKAPMPPIPGMTAAKPRALSSLRAQALPVKAPRA